MLGDLCDSFVGVVGAIEVTWRLTSGLVRGSIRYYVTGVLARVTRSGVSSDIVRAGHIRWTLRWTLDG